MYAHVNFNEVNSTVHDDNQPPLSPGLIATITIVSVFVFYLSIMVIVCLAEYCQYISGKKAKPVRHIRPQQPVASTANDIANTTQRHSLLYADQSTSYSDPRTTSFNSVNSYRISERCGTGDAKHKVVPDKQCSVPPDPPGTSVTSPATMHEVVIHHPEIVDQPSPDCLEGCSRPYVTVPSEHDMSVLPLISRTCDETSTEGGLCETATSNEFQKLEASV